MLSYAWLSALCVFVSSAHGGLTTLDINDKEVIKKADDATKVLNEYFLTPYLRKLGQINSTQEIARADGYSDYLYSVYFITTKCEKAEVSYEEIDCCEQQEGVLDDKTLCKIFLFYRRGAYVPHPLNFCGKLRLDK